MMKHAVNGGVNGYCSVHVLGNILNDINFDLYVGNPKYECADTAMQNEILDKEGYDFKIYDVLNFPSTIKLDKRLFKKIVEFDYLSYFSSDDVKYPVIVFLLTVKPIGINLHHAVALIRTKEGWLYSDSNKPEMIKINNSTDVFNYISDCSGISMFHVKNGIEYNIAALKGENFGYLN